jgi:hypothetical protein
MFKVSYIYDLVDNISPQLKTIQANLEATRSKTQKIANSMSTSLNQVVTKLDNLGTKFTRFGKDMFVKATLPIGLVAGSFIKIASDYSESINKVDVAFGNASQTVKDFANTAGKNFGIDRGTALDMAAMFGDMSTSMGLSQIKASELSTSLVGLAGDLASFKNLNISEVQTALSGIFTGETESLKRLGVVMTEENLNQFLLTQGIAKKMSNLTQAQKVLQRYNYVLQMTSNSHGDFIRTQAGFANQMRIMRSSYNDLSIQLGMILLPYAIQFIGVLNKTTQYFQQLTPETQKMILIIGGLIAILPPLVIIFGSIILAVKGLIIGLSFLASPIGALTTLIIGLITLFFLFKNDLIAIKDFIVNEFAPAFDYVANKIKFVMDLINRFRTDTAIVLDFIGLEKLSKIISPELNQQTQINKPQQLTAGGQLDVNINGLPKGSSAGFTPRPNNFLPVGVNAVFAGS